MSATAQVTFLGPSGVGARARPSEGSARSTPLALAAFALLGGYGLLRWSTMLTNPPVARLFGLLALSLAVAAIGRLSDGRQRSVRIAAGIAVTLGVLAMFPLSGLPLAWLVHVRIAVTVRAIGNGIGALPGVVVPYGGFDPTVQDVIVLGAGSLLVLGGLVLGAGRGPSTQVRLAAAAFPAIVLATVPSVLARPQLAYLHGALLFGLVALLVFSQRLMRRRAARAWAPVLVTAVVALGLGSALDPAHPWINVQKLTGTVVIDGSETFDWAQTYGPLVWPHTGTTVLEVRARFPTYWKAESLDYFNGQGWIAEPVSLGDALSTVSAANLARWTQPLSVTLKRMSTSDVIAAGMATELQLPNGEPAQPGSSPGTFVSSSPLLPGQTYQVDAYTPEPSPQQLAAAGEDFPLGDLAPELQMQLPPNVDRGSSAPLIQFAPYGAGAAVDGGPSIQQALAHSPYRPVFALAQQLVGGTSSPYQYVQAVLGYLSHGFAYTQSPPPSAFPIVSFLTTSRAGYCQQFAGAMALLLRMGGVPARVAAGFATGRYSQANHRYLVSDIDAHSWVEAWFAGIGWVKFDPTPDADPALGGTGDQTRTTPASQEPAHRSLQAHNRAPKAAGAATARRRPGEHRSSGSGFPVLLLILLALALLAAPAALWLRRRRAGRGPSPEALLAELERAFARCGRPLPDGVTLAMLELRFADAPDAAAYLRALREARYAETEVELTTGGRRAVRGRLRRGLGVRGWLLAAFALPPRRAWPETPGRRLH